MSNQVHRIESYTFSSTDFLLFDTNVWLYIYGPQGKQFPRYRNVYTYAFRRIRSAKSRILLDILVLSEFINAYARFFYNNLPSRSKQVEFKTFRNSADFKPVAQEITKKARKILEKCERTESGFESVNLGGILNAYAAGEADFNDQMLAELCRAKSLKLVTHDSDFSSSNLTILTANAKLLT